jgi:hypothetical protein
MARIGLTAGSSSAPDHGFAVGSMAAELDMDTVAVMVTVVRATRSDAADTAMQAVADMPVELAGTLAAVNAAGTVAAGRLSAADSVAVAVAAASAVVAAGASTAAVVDTGKRKADFKVVGDPISRSCGGWDFWRLGDGL